MIRRSKLENFIWFRARECRRFTKAGESNCNAAAAQRRVHYRHERLRRGV